MREHISKYLLLFSILAVTALLSACRELEEALRADKEITNFIFKANDNDLDKDERANISETTITVTVPYGTDVTSLKPTVVIKGASVDPPSGEVKDFTTPVAYRVTAEDGSTEVYTVTVTEMLSFNSVSYYEGANRIGAGDFEKSGLFEIGDIVDGNYNYSLKIGSKRVVDSENTTVTNGKITIAGSTLSTSDWSDIGEGEVTIQLTIKKGDGEEKNFNYTTTKEQYSIRSWQDLQGMKYNLNGDYILMNDIDLPEPSQTGGDFPDKLPSAGFDPIGSNSTRFTGSFDGSGNIIGNFFISRGSSNNVGLFGYISNATIKNVGIEISAGGVTGDSRVGGLVGSSRHSTIENNYTTGDVSGKEYIGGLIGHSFTNAIKFNYATGNVTATENYAGGLVGSGIEGTLIAENYATGSVTGDDKVGGLLGHAKIPTFITENYATGRVTATGVGTSVGGLVGESETAVIAENYWDKSSTRQDSSSGGGRGISSGTNLIKSEDDGKYYDTGPAPNVEVFTGWYFSTGGDFFDRWRWQGDGKWPLLYMKGY